MLQPGRSAAKCEQQDEARQARIGSVDGSGNFDRTLVVKQVGVQNPGIDARDHHVALVMRTVRDDAGDTGLIGRDLGDVDAGSNIDPAFDASPVESVGERAQTASEMPDAELLLDVGDRRQDSRRLARIRSGVGGVPVQQRHGARVGQHRAS